MSIKIEGLDKLKRQLQANSQTRTIFNNSLNAMVKDWAKATKQTLTTSKSLSQIEGLFKIKPLEHKGKFNYRANIEILIFPEKLSNFAYDQVRITTGNNKIRVERKRKNKFVNSGTKTYTKVKILKSSNYKQAKIPKGINKIPDIGNKGFLFKKSSRITANASTPTGIYIRTSNKRYPVIMLRPLPLAYMINSRRIKDTLKFEQHVNHLINILKP